MTIRINISIMFLILISVVGCANRADQKEAIWSVAEAKDVTFKILAFDESGEAISTGSAFKVGDDIVSAAHVLIGADSVEIYDSHGDLVASTETVLQVDNLKDIVILDVDVDGYEGLEVERGPISVGSDIWAVGAPMGLDGTVSKGVVSSVREDEVGRRLQFTAPVSPGSSGGPVLNSQGRVVGMTIETVREGQNLNFAISADHIVALANQTPSVEKIGDIQSVPEDDDVRVFVDMATGFANAENIEYGDLVSGSLEDGDYEIDGFWDFYMFRGEEGDIVEIILSSQGHKVRGSLIVGSTIFSDNTAGLDGEFVGNKNIVYTKLPGDDEYYFIVAGDKNGKIDYQFHLLKENKESRYGDQWVYVSHNDSGEYFYIHEDVASSNYGERYVWTLRKV